MKERATRRRQKWRVCKGEKGEWDCKDVREIAGCGFIYICMQAGVGYTMWKSKGDSACVNAVIRKQSFTLSVAIPAVRSCSWQNKDENKQIWTILGLSMVDRKTHLSIIELMGSNQMGGFQLRVHFMLLLRAWKMTLMDAVFLFLPLLLISDWRGPEVSLPSKC